MTRTSILPEPYENRTRYLRRQWKNRKSVRFSAPVLHLSPVGRKVRYCDTCPSPLVVQSIPTCVFCGKKDVACSEDDKVDKMEKGKEKETVIRIRSVSDPPRPPSDGEFAFRGPWRSSATAVELGLRPQSGASSSSAVLSATRSRRLGRGGGLDTDGTGTGVAAPSRGGALRSTTVARSTPSTGSASPNLGSHIAHFPFNFHPQRSSPLARDPGTNASMSATSRRYAHGHSLSAPVVGLEASATRPPLAHPADSPIPESATSSPGSSNPPSLRHKRHFIIDFDASQPLRAGPAHSSLPSARGRRSEECRRPDATGSSLAATKHARAMSQPTIARPPLYHIIRKDMSPPPTPGLPTSSSPSIVSSSLPVTAQAQSPSILLFPPAPIRRRTDSDPFAADTDEEEIPPTPLFSPSSRVSSSRESVDTARCAPTLFLHRRIRGRSRHKAEEKDAAVALARDLGRDKPKKSRQSLCCTLRRVLTRLRTKM